MMKKILLTLLLVILFCTPVFANEEELYYGKHAPAGCVKDTVDLVMDQTTDDGGASMSTNAMGQSISYGSAWTLHSFNVEFGATCSSCVVTFRIGASTDLGTYMEQWASVAIADGGELKEFVSVDQDAYDASTTYYIGGIENSGTCVWRYKGTASSYPGGMAYPTGTLWNLGSPLSDRDQSAQVFKCQ